MKRISTLILLLLAAASSHAQQWRPAGGPEGGSVTRMAVSGSSILAMVSPGVLHRRDEHGWTRLANLDALDVQAVGSTFVAATPEGIFRSVDRGESWEQVGPQGSWYRLAVHDDMFHVAVDSAIYRSVDHGGSWSRIATPGVDFFSFFVHDSIVLIGRGNNQGLFRSGDGGQTWSKVTAGLPAGQPPQAFHRRGSTLYTSIDSRGVFRSIDGGATWTAINDGLPQQGGGYPIILSFATFGDELWGTGQQGTYAYDGSRWRVVDLDNNRALATANGVIYRASMRGVWAIADTGKPWTSLNDGLMAHRIHAIAGFGNAAAGDMVVASAAGSIFRSTDNGANWTEAAAIGVSRFVKGGGSIYALGQSPFARGLFRSVDGLDWGRIESGLPHEVAAIRTLAATGDTVFVGYYKITYANNQTVWLNGGVYRSIDRGATWRAVNTGLPNNGTSDVPVFDIIAGGRIVLAQTLAGLYRSSNGGESWELVQSTLPGSLSSAIFVRLRDEYFIARNSTVHRSSDGGATWQAVGEGIPSTAQILFASAVRGTVYLSATDGVQPARIYRWSGERWSDVTGELPEGVHFQMFVEAGGSVLAGTLSNSVWVGTFSHAAVPDRGDIGTIDLVAAPNPFGSGATVGFRLDRRGDVRLTLVSPLGEEIMTIHEGALEEGTHHMRFDAGSLPAGVYHLRLASDGRIVTKGIVKVR